MKITCMILLAGSLSSCAGAPAEPQQTADAPVAIAFASEEVSLRSAAGAVPYTPLSSHPVELVITLADGREVSAVGYDLKFSSADAAVAVVDNGRIEAVGQGETVVRATLGDLSASIGVSVTPAGVSTTGVGEFDADNIYSKGVYLVRNTVMQGFDIDSDGSIWYMQLGGSDKHDLYVMHARRGESPAERMIFRYSGHGTNMAVERSADGKRYVWTGTYGSRNSSNDYWSNSVVTRTEFVDGATALPEQCGDLFYLGGICELHPAIDAAGDVLAINYPGSSQRMFVMYRLSEAMALPRSYVTLPSRNWGGGTSTDPASTNSPKAYVRDLTKLTPLGRFGIPKSGEDHSTDISSYAWQGFDVDSGKIYYFEGEGTVKEGSAAYFTVFDFEGNIIEPRTEVAIALPSRDIWRPRASRCTAMRCIWASHRVPKPTATSAAPTSSAIRAPGSAPYNYVHDMLRRGGAYFFAAFPLRDIECLTVRWRIPIL